jgi:hypothetical protein
LTSDFDFSVPTSTNEVLAVQMSGAGVKLVDWYVTSRSQPGVPGPPPKKRKRKAWNFKSTKPDRRFVTVLKQWKVPSAQSDFIQKTVLRLPTISSHVIFSFLFLCLLSFSFFAFAISFFIYLLFLSLFSPLKVTQAVVAVGKPDVKKTGR